MRRRAMGLAALLILAASAWWWSARSTLQMAVDASTVAYTGSERCADCHQDRHDSWHRTWHRTMTQEANAQSVVGRFDGQRLQAFGGTVEPIQTAGGYAFRYLDPASGAELTTLTVARTVGSHRYQQYLMRDDSSETYYRLHYLWHIEEQRWVHMNSAFLGRDDQPFDAQVSNWNTQCVQCHNTGAQPRVSNLEAVRARARAGERFDVRAELRFDTQVAELGISCESCHGPGGAHVARMQRWDRRLLARWIRDVSIVDPQTLPGPRANDVCGACHAARTLKDASALDHWMQEGSAYRPGDVLSDHVVPLAADTPSPSAAAPDLYRNRFWADGSVRLSAYEYQGVQASPCAQDSEYTCIGCHSMHTGDPAGMLTERNRGDAPCLRCHTELRTQVAQHAGHPAESPGARCVNCHMPKAVYGVMTIHRSHQISIPNPARDVALGKPNACLNCHAEEAAGWRGATVVRQDGADPALADGLAALIAGDPVRQAVAAFELGVVEHAPGPQALRVRVPWLIAALEDDRPAIRRFAWRSLRAIDQALTLGLAGALQAFDYTGAPADRAAALQAITLAYAKIDKSGWPRPAAPTALGADYQLDPTVLATLRTLGARSDKQIDIGE
ncbi:MAG: cytochrome c3 family protein [Lysobacterales bacterium]